ncbi:MAG: diaminopimelate decarboxylase [Deltaproteobacteria bacterium]|jgi:diaminopimelate decarboxylase|nr:diaminopimelate decarboxylase [Deltaproteobacteria bacterium]
MANIRSSYTGGVNFFGGNDPLELIRQYGSPLYVYNEEMLRRRSGEMRDLVKLPSFKACYSAKANANPHLLRIVRSEGLLVDSMSLGELLMTRAAGFESDEILFVCNNVSAEEFKQAQASSRVVSVDSLSQLELFGKNVPAGSRVMVRVNPGIGAGHHKKVVTAGKETKFGVNVEDLPRAVELCEKYKLQLFGINQHIGSLFMEPDKFLAAAARLLEIVEPFKELEIIDFGGGYGIPYHKYENEARLDLADLGQRFAAMLEEFTAKTGYRGRFVIEPGRYVPAESGVLLGSVTAVKNNGPVRFVCTDVGFNILPRPMLYDSFHDVEIYRQGNPAPDSRTMPQTLVGNICESGDILARDRELPEVQEGDVLGFLDAGAYCFAMSSNYNQRVRPAEILIDRAGKVKLIRRREVPEDLIAMVTPLD